MEADQAFASIPNMLKQTVRPAASSSSRFNGETSIPLRHVPYSGDQIAGLGWQTCQRNEAMPEVDARIVDAQSKSSRAQKLADSYLKMARVCDWNAATRWHGKAKDALEKAERAIGHIRNISPAPPTDHAIYITRAKRDFARAKKTLGEAERIFRACVNPRTAPKVLFRFDGVTNYDIPSIERVNPGIAGDPFDKITISATMRGDCSEPCFVSVYSFEKADTGERADPPSKGDKRYGPGGNPTSAPKDVDSFDGFIVDAPPNHTKPCWPSSSYDSSNKKLSAVDAPNVVRNGYIGSFETCAVCIEDGRVTVLGCMRWTVDSNNKVATNLQHLGQSPQPSPPYERALKHWLNRRAP